MWIFLGCGRVNNNEPLKPNKMQAPTENEIKMMGFCLVKSYCHDEWYTERYVKGVLQLELTYLKESNKLDSYDVTVDEVLVSPTLKELKQLDNILN
jgi:hypothetical protein